MMNNDVGFTENSKLFFNTIHGFDEFTAKIDNMGEDPTNGMNTRYQSYEIENPFSNVVSKILDGENGLWEFSLITETTITGNYCFRIVNNDNIKLDGYNFYPEINVSSP